MTQQEYEQKRAELWYEYTAMLRRNCASRYVFDKIFDRAYDLGKQEKDADTVIQGWVTRNGSGPYDLGLRIYTVKPDRMKNRREWNGHGEMSYLIDYRLFPDLTWDSEPEPVEIIIKRK